MGLLAPFWGGICHLPLLNPTLKAKTLPPSSIFPDSPCPSNKLLSFQNREGMGEEEAEKPCLAMSRSRPPTPQASLQLKVFYPQNVSPSPELCTVIRERAGWISGPLPMAGLCCSLQQGQRFTPLSASAAGLVLLAFYMLRLNVSIWLLLQQ